jgi:Cdc6-like AAA superfamily ATPase
MTAPATASSIRPEILEFADPLSALALDALATRRDAREEQSVSIRSDAMRVLVAELRRYCDLEVGGRSFLISGHRGAGKTTMIQHAFREVFLAAKARRLLLRPVYVQLHGPSLFPDFLAAADAVAPLTVAGRSGS